MEDNSKMKLGKKSPIHDLRTLQLANYIIPKDLPPIPTEYDWGKNVTNWGMMKNDIAGDCTCAAAGHLIMAWTANAGNIITPTDDDIIKAYSAVAGYDPNTRLNDNGAVETEVLNYWRATGIANHKIMAYASLEPKNDMHIKQAIYIFGGCYIGVALPKSAQNQDVWSVPPGGAVGYGSPGSWGGHAICIESYDEHGLTCITWGQPKRMTWEFWNTYCEESYAIITQDFFDKNNKTPIGFDLAAIEQDLREITA